MDNTEIVKLKSTDHKFHRGDQSLAGSSSTLKDTAPFRLANEAFSLFSASVRLGVNIPLKLTKAALTDPRIESFTKEERFFDIFGDLIMDYFNALGPIYGKAGQVFLSRLPKNLADLSETLRLTRLYGDWPSMDFREVLRILDQEIPTWRTELTVHAHPIGVASMAQVHVAEDNAGKKWVIKVLKPDAVKRLSESLAALEATRTLLRPLAVTMTAARALDELGDLIEGFRREVSLNNERETILKVRDRLKTRRQHVLKIPHVHDHLHSDSVLVLELFEGVNLADVVAGKADLNEAQKKKLAKEMVNELLIQVFEMGLFHADPHAGNLILTEDGTLGLFDWGLAGELSQRERQHIASILKAVVTLDMEKLVDALMQMAADQGVEVERSKVKKELTSLTRLVKKTRELPREQRPGLHQLFEACLKAADRVKIKPPTGLLLMVKSIITLEGLAKGIDPNIPLLRIAGPILLKASKPSFTDWVRFIKKMPALKKQVL